jgi:cytochrome P450
VNDDQSNKDSYVSAYNETAGTETSYETSKRKGTRPHYAAMRKLGPVVWLPQHGNYALTQYKEVADCLRDPETFCSGRPSVPSKETGHDRVEH